MIKKITILCGVGKENQKDQIDKIELKMGDIISIVGPTGSGKTTLINDIELFANNDTPTKRTILINDEIPLKEYKEDPSKNPIALITQHTNFLSDMTVIDFLKTHAKIRSKIATQIDVLVKETIDFANQLTGEQIDPKYKMTQLSGGQTRSLLIADATIICNTPIVLLDEVENAGINRSKALELLKKYQKIFVFVTHDPQIILQSDFRIIMQKGAITKVIHTKEDEKKCSTIVNQIDATLTAIREKLRIGQLVNYQDLKELK